MIWYFPAHRLTHARIARKHVTRYRTGGRVAGTVPDDWRSVVCFVIPRRVGSHWHCTSHIKRTLAYIARAFTAFRAWGLNFKGIEIQHFSSQLVITLHSHLHAYGRAVNISVDVPKCVLALLLTEPSWQLLLNLGGFHGLTKTRLHWAITVPYSTL